MNKAVTILGSTGSIGTQTLEVCREHGFGVVALAAHSNITLLEQQVREFRPKRVLVVKEEQYLPLKTALADLSAEVLTGSQALCDLAQAPDTDLVVDAVVGIAGLPPTLAALQAGKRLALANKEALIAGGSLVKAAEKTGGGELLTVDSEHSAIWQSLQGSHRGELRGIILTASGGPFFGRTRRDLEQVGVKDALAHPNWSMGAKITVDSATLMNKGLEFIEAMWLFDLSWKQIEVVVHRQSILHSAVDFVDGSVIGQMSIPDMRGAIQYAMTYPNRLPLSTKKLSLTDIGSLTFEKPDLSTFTCLRTCIEAAQMGGFMPCIANGANEQAVGLFLEGKISFLQIGDLVEQTTRQYSSFQQRIPTSVEEILEADQMAREYVQSQI